MESKWDGVTWHLLINSLNIRYADSIKLDTIKRFVLDNQSNKKFENATKRNKAYYKLQLNYDQIKNSS